MIPQNIIDKVREASSMHDVISEFVTLQKQGVNYLGSCPFHSEKTASFVVSESKGFYKCFGCGEGGNNVFSFIMKHENMSFPEAVEYVAAKYKIEIPKVDLTPEEKQKKDARENYFRMTTFAREFFSAKLPGSHASKYMQERGFAKDDLLNFGIGYGPDSWDDFKNKATSQFKEAELQAAGLLSKNDKGRFFDRFRNRAMFPIHNLTGMVVGFTGRILKEEDKVAKYLNTSENEYFTKGAVLYGLYQAKQHITKAGAAFLVEGNTDVIRFHQRSVQNTIGTMGTALTQQHARLIKRFTTNLTIVFDGDSAGIKAAVKGIDICLAEGLNVYVALLPAGEDPDSFAKNMQPDELKKWLEDNSEDFILFRAKLAAEQINNKPAEKAALVNELLDSIKKVPDLATREEYFNQAAEVLKLDRDKFEKGILDEKEEELFGLKTNADAIREEGLIILFDNKNKAMQSIARGDDNVIAFSGNLNSKHIGQMYELCPDIIIDYSVTLGDFGVNESTLVKTLKTMTTKGFRIKVESSDSSDMISFIDYYFQVLANPMLIDDADTKRLHIELASEFLSKLDSTTINLMKNKVAKLFNVPKGDFNNILKPHEAKKKGHISQRNEAITVDGTPHHFDIDNLPGYVDNKFLSKYKHFPVENNKGLKIFYMFQRESGNLAKVGNFFMEPQFQVFSDDPNKNKRVVRLNHADTHTSRYVEIPSNDMIEFGAFKKFLWRQGPYMLSGAKAQDLDYILSSVALDFPVTHELEIFGQQHEGFFAFSNAIVDNGEVRYMNDLGLIDYDGKTFYSPAFSCIYKDLRHDNDQFAQQRTFIYKKANDVTFEQWAELLVEVYKYNHNGHWALLMAILSAFRSDIFPIDRLFTTLFLAGPTECGKSQIAISIRSLFVDRDAPLFNLNSGTDASMFTLMEMLRDVPIVMEEYNDMQISDVKFQGLKAAVYDGEGKTKRKDATSKSLDMSEVNGVPILLGQEAPERDDGSLANRTVFCPVKKKDDWTEDEVSNFKLLKEWEKQGLTHILVKVLGQRPVIRQHFQKKLRIVQKDLRKDLQSSGILFQTRILNTISLFLALVKVFEEFVKDLQLPFSYDEFYQIAREKLIAQSDQITTTNRLSVFWDTFVLLTEQKNDGLLYGKDYKIELIDTAETREGRGKTDTKTWPNPKKVLFLRLENIHPKYKRVVGADEHLKPNNLRNYMKDHLAYIGNCPRTMFKWEEEVRVKEGQSGVVVSKMQSSSTRSSAVMFDYELLGIDLASHNNQERAFGSISQSEAVNQTGNSGGKTWTEKTIEFEQNGQKDDEGEDLPF